MSLKLVSDNNTQQPPAEPNISYNFEVTYKTDDGLTVDFVEGYPIVGSQFLSIMKLQDGVGVPTHMYPVGSVQRVVQVKQDA